MSVSEVGVSLLAGSSLTLVSVSEVGVSLLAGSSLAIVSVSEVGDWLSVASPSDLISVSEVSLDRVLELGLTTGTAGVSFKIFSI